jgi:hypothetical protein
MILALASRKVIIEATRPTKPMTSAVVLLHLGLPPKSFGSQSNVVGNRLRVIASSIRSKKAACRG